MSLADSSAKEDFFTPTSTPHRVTTHDLRGSEAEATEEGDLKSPRQAKRQFWDKTASTLPSGTLSSFQMSQGTALSSSTMGVRALSTPHPTPTFVPLPSTLGMLCSQSRNPLDSLQHADFGPCVRSFPFWPSTGPTGKAMKGEEGRQDHGFWLPAYSQAPEGEDP